jgi:hypothetical protein
MTFVVVVATSVYFIYMSSVLVVFVSLFHSESAPMDDRQQQERCRAQKGVPTIANCCCSRLIVVAAAVLFFSFFCFRLLWRMLHFLVYFFVGAIGLATCLLCRGSTDKQAPAPYCIALTSSSSWLMAGNGGVSVRVEWMKSLTSSSSSSWLLSLFFFRFCFECFEYFQLLYSKNHES